MHARMAAGLYVGATQSAFVGGLQAVLPGPFHPRGPKRRLDQRLQHRSAGVIGGACVVGACHAARRTLAAYLPVAPIGW
jgi:hypothetical protein